MNQEPGTRNDRRDDEQGELAEHSNQPRRRPHTSRIERSEINQEHAPEARVFVYGTLRRGGSNAFRMEGCEWLGTATAKGHLYKVDWYPGMVLNCAANPVIGDLYRVSEAQMAGLDEYEGREYRRVETEVRLEDGTSTTAWVWEWDRATEGLTLIANGDWLATFSG